MAGTFSLHSPYIATFLESQINFANKLKNMVENIFLLQFVG